MAHHDPPSRGVFYSNLRSIAHPARCSILEEKALLSQWDSNTFSPRASCDYPTGCRFSSTISQSGALRFDGTAYGLDASGQPVKWVVVYSFQYGSLVSGMLGNCSTIIFCRPMKRSCWERSFAPQ